MTWEEISKELFEKKTAKRYFKEDFYNEYAIKKEDTIIAIVDSGSNARKICDELNTLYDENEQLKQLNIPVDEIRETVRDYKGRIVGVYYND